MADRFPRMGIWSVFDSEHSYRRLWVLVGGFSRGILRNYGTGHWIATDLHQ